LKIQRREVPKIPGGHCFLSKSHTFWFYFIIIIKVFLKLACRVICHHSLTPLCFYEYDFYVPKDRNKLLYFLRCEGVFCNANTGFCEGPAPWFCKSSNILSGKTEPAFCRTDDHCDVTSQCCQTTNERCSNLDLSCRDPCNAKSRQKLKVLIK
jgi:hypothetical protein